VKLRVSSNVVLPSSDMKPKAIVTGASGFVARNLIARLQGKGWDVIGVGRTAGGNIMTWEAFWRSGFDADTVVFHLAAHIPDDMEDCAQVAACLDVNAMLTLRLAEFMANQEGLRLVLGSTGQIYRYQIHPADELSPAETSGRACFYLSSKMLGETFVERTRMKHGLNSIILRISSCYGPGMAEKSLVARFATLALAGSPLKLRFGGLERFDMIHVDDVVELLIRAASSQAQGIFNAGTGRGLTVREIADAVNLAYGNAGGIVLDGPEKAPAQPGFAPLCMKKSMAAFGWKPRSFQDGICQYREWDENRSYQ